MKIKFDEKTRSAIGGWTAIGGFVAILLGSLILPHSDEPATPKTASYKKPHYEKPAYTYDIWGFAEDRSETARAAIEALSDTADDCLWESDKIRLANDIFEVAMKSGSSSAKLLAITKIQELSEDCWSSGKNNCKKLIKQLATNV